MTDLKAVLSEASAAGFIEREQVEPFELFLRSRNVGLSLTSDKVPAAKARVEGWPAGENSVSDTEMPRFVRGFHDILITIGILVFMAGIVGFATSLAGLPAIIILSEILVRRQRLALPAVTLSLGIMIWTVWMAYVIASPTRYDTTAMLQILLPLPVVLGVYYRGYRVPLSLALFLASTALLCVVAILAGLAAATGVASFTDSYPLLSSILQFGCALALFAVALRFDLSDWDRQTHRSDVAFWLHLASAPALLYTTLSLAAGGHISTLFTQMDGAAIIFVVVLSLMVIGIALDRRAFVTAGLISLIAAVVKLLIDRSSVDQSVAWSLSMLLVGALVLAIGTHWSLLRRRLMSLLPLWLQAKLPPLR